MATSSQRAGELSSTGSVDSPGRVSEAHSSTGDAGIASADTAPTRADAHASAGQTTPSSRAASGGSGAGETPSTHAAAGGGDTPTRVTGGGDGAARTTGSGDAAGHMDHSGHGRSSADGPAGGAGDSARPRPDAADGAGTGDRTPARPGADAPDGGHGRPRPEVDGADTARPRSDADAPGDGGGRHRRPETADGSSSADADARRPRSDADAPGDGGGRHRRPETADGSTNGDDRHRSDNDPADAPDSETPDHHGGKADTPESAAGDPDGHHDSNAPDDHGKPDSSDASSSDDGDHGDADGSDASDGSGDGSDADDGGDSSKSDGDKPPSHISEWKEMTVEERRAQSDADPFNQKHRPDIGKNEPVEVGPRHKLYPGKKTPFGARGGLDPNTCYHVEGRGDYYTNSDGEVCHVETNSKLVTGSFNVDLRNPFPNATYTVDGKFHYTTDEWSRTIRVEIDSMPQVDKNERVRSDALQSNVAKIGKSAYPESSYPKLTYDGGHLAGAQFGGIPEEINIVPMKSGVNQNSGYLTSDTNLPPDSDIYNRYYDWETEVVNSYKEGGRGYSSIVITIEYPEVPIGSTSLSDAQMTPNEFTAKWNDSQGASHDRRFVNAPGVE